MKTKNIYLMALVSLVLGVAVFLFLNRDKFIYVGPIKMVEVDCSDKRSILDSVYRSDQRIRQANLPFAQYAKEDHRNQELVISIIEKCGMPSLEEVNPK